MRAWGPWKMVVSINEKFFSREWLINIYEKMAFEMVDVVSYTVLQPPTLAPTPSVRMSDTYSNPWIHTALRKRKERRAAQHGRKWSSERRADGEARQDEGRPSLREVSILKSTREKMQESGLCRFSPYTGNIGTLAILRERETR